MQRTQIIIVRHGQTEWNIRGIRQGYLDSPLTAKGARPGKSFGAALGAGEIHRAVQQRSGRALQTAQEVAKVTGHEIVTDARLRERHLGIFQGLNAEEINAKHPEERRLMRSQGPGYVIPGGESMVQQVERNIECLNELAKRHQGEQIVVVTHGGVVSGFFRHTLEIALEAPRRFEFVNAGINVFAHEDGNWMLLTWGDVSHLAPGAASEGDDP